MKTEDLKNYIFEQCLTEAKIHPLVMRGAQWVADNIGGDAKKLAHRMSRGINRTTNEPTPQHVYNAAQFHFGEILRKNSPSMDRPEIYADMRTRLRAHLGMESEVNETSDALKQKLEDGRREQAMKAYDTSNDIFKEWEKIYKRTGKIDQNLDTVRKFMGDKATTLMASVKKVRNRRIGLKGDGSPRTPTQESAFNFIMGLKRLTETSDALKTKLTDGRFDQAIRALGAGNELRRENLRMSKKTGRLDPILMTVADNMSDRGDKATRSYLKANNRRKGLRGDGSPR